MNTLPILLSIISSLRVMNVLLVLDSTITIKRNVEAVAQLVHSQQKILLVLIVETVTILMEGPV